MNLEMWQ